MSSRNGPRRKRPETGRRRHWPWALAVVVLLVAALAVLRQPLAERLWPQARIDHLLADGDAALAAGRLDQADGQGARQKFEAAQALDSDRGEARAGLARVGAAALARARQATGDRQYVEARHWLQLAADLQVPRAQVEPVAARLRQAEAAGVDLPALRGRAEAALAAGDAEAALSLYAQWLALEPGDTAALEGREDALSLLLERVPRALRDGDLAAAAHWLALAQRHDPGHPQLPGRQADYSRALAAQVRRALAQQRAGRLEAAAAAFGQLRAAAPDDPAVVQGAHRTALALAAEARRLAVDYRFAEADRALALARSLAAGMSEVEEAGRVLARARASAARLGEGPAVARVSPAALRGVLDGFEQAMRRGDWIEPPGASANDRLRAAQAQAPQDPAVRAAATRMRDAAADCVGQALRDNRLRTAQDCHDAWQALAPADPALAATGQRLAQRWLAVGEERLRAGELDVAMRALAAARDLDPATPGLDDFAARLQRARAATP